ncbi:hypothetical protein QUF56_09420 [Ureibacillus composti]|nr:hypothetical protein [Ureibacillus composti]
MSSFFTLTLDTTAPHIDVYAPTYTTPQAEFEVLIKANERLAEYQEIFAIDSVGEKHDFIFMYENNAYFGIVDVSKFSIGIATIYVRVCDVVGNLSDTLMVNMDIKQAINIDILSTDTIRAVIVNEETRKVIVNENFRSVSSNETIRLLFTNEKLGKSR